MMKINPCMFCHGTDCGVGAEEKTYLGEKHYFVVCDSVGCLAHGPVCNTPEEAVDKWNTGSQPTPDMIRAGVEFALRSSLGGDYKWPDYIKDLYNTMNNSRCKVDG